MQAVGASGGKSWIQKMGVDRSKSTPGEVLCVGTSVCLRAQQQHADTPKTSKGLRAFATSAALALPALDLDKWVDEHRGFR
ncbi:hypothetical protein L1887_55719 [Cichorium endivia]|nr:hypothetical protein L1887_55719 [Cichorium endivia]